MCSPRHFNNLLTVITAAISMARKEVPAGSLGWELLGDGAQASAGAAALTARLLAFSRKAPVATEVVDSRKALGGLAELLPRAIEALACRGEVDLREELHVVVAAWRSSNRSILNPVGHQRARWMP